jgi:hypothetical protein
MGWAIDARRLYIGNGHPDEGAPLVGNTEILTEHSDITRLSGMYTYDGFKYTGYSVQTGPGALSPIKRTLGEKFDDFANFRDFGGVGDGTVNEVVELNHAISELYSESFLAGETRVRRTLYLSAGIYVVSGESIKLLPYVKLKGDGKNATFIIQVGQIGGVVTPLNTQVNSVIETVGAGAITPGFNQIEDITFITTMQHHALLIDSAHDMYFKNVRFQYVPVWGNTAIAPAIANSSASILPVPVPDGFSSSCIAIKASTFVPTLSTFTFENCEFAGATNAMSTASNNNKINILFTGCYFTKLYRGFDLSIGTYEGSVKVTASAFAEIAHEAIVTSNNPSTTRLKVVSAYNTFTNVGNTLTSTSVFPILDLWSDNSYSIGDTFDRIYTDAIPPINLRGSASFATLPDGKMMLGKQHHAGGSSITLTDNSVAVAGVVGYGNYPTKLEYTVRRGTEQRIGTMHITPVGSALTFSDDYVETGEIGVELIPTLTSGTIELTYTTTPIAADATLTVASRTLT